MRGKWNLFIAVCAMVIMTAVPVFAADAVGGWEVAETTYSFLSAGQRRIFEKGIDEDLEDDYEPVVVLAKQVVNGTRYVFLCQDTDEEEWNIVTMVRATNKKVTFGTDNDLEIANIAYSDKPRSGNTAGGLMIRTIKNRPAALENDVRNVFTKALTGYTTYSLRPIALLGTQLVAGTNYRFLCLGIGSGVKDLFIVDVYNDLQGVSKVTSCKPLDLETYVK